jgi:DNA-binding SARP family transcriptional activator
VLDPDLVTVDLHQFLAALEAAARARAANGAQSAAEEIRVLQRARALYTGPLLAGRETDYPWVAELQDTYRGKERAATERLAGLLRAWGRPQEAAALYRDLLRDSGPAEVERDDGNHYAYREQMARGLFECYRQLRDLGGLVRARDELLGILERLDAEDMTEEATRLGTATTSLFAAIYRDLATDEPPAAAARGG